MDEREIARVARSAAESVYGVVEVVGSGWFDRLAARLNLGKSGVTVARNPSLILTADIRVADGVPAHQVAANVAEKIRYAVQRDLAAAIDHVEIRVDGQRVELPAPDQSASPVEHSRG